MTFCGIASRCREWGRGEERARSKCASLGRWGRLRASKNLGARSGSSRTPGARSAEIILIVNKAVMDIVRAHSYTSASTGSGSAWSTTSFDPEHFARKCETLFRTRRAQPVRGAVLAEIAKVVLVPTLLHAKVRDISFERRESVCWAQVVSTLRDTAQP